MKKVYLAQLERFGYTLTAVRGSRAEAEKAILKAYTKAFADVNDGENPAFIECPGTGESYYALAKKELYVEEATDKVLWL